MRNDTTPAMVIVGGGHAGGRAAQCLREAGWSGAIHLVGLERHVPYERPPLSKGLLTGDTPPEACQLRSVQALMDDGVHLHNQCVSALDTAQRCVTLANGQILPYHRLLLATGGTARSLSIPGAELPEVQSLRTLDDALLLAQRLGAKRHLLVVGGGFIGLEVAATARRCGMAVTVLEGGPRLMGRGVSADIAADALALHRSQGVDIRLGTLPTSIEARQAGGVRVHLSDGRHIDTDTVLVGIGMKPSTELAQAAGLTVAQGIVVDNCLQTSAPDVYAAGDVAEFPSPLSGQLMRQETWFNAEMQARVAAFNMAGIRTVHTHTPWFWSDQYEHQLQVCGEPALGTHTVVRDLGHGDRIVFHLDAQDTVLGMSAWGAAGRCLKEFKLARLLVERRVHANADDLQNLSVKLKSLASQGIAA